MPLADEVAALIAALGNDECALIAAALEAVDPDDPSDAQNARELSARFAGLAHGATPS